MQKREKGTPYGKTPDSGQHNRKDKNRTERHKTEPNMIDTKRAGNTVRTMNTGKTWKEREEGRMEYKGRNEGREEGRKGQAPKGKEGMKKGRKAGRWRWTGRMAGREQE